MNVIQHEPINEISPYVQYYVALAFSMFAPPNQESIPRILNLKCLLSSYALNVFYICLFFDATKAVNKNVYA